MSRILMDRTPLVIGLVLGLLFLAGPAASESAADASPAVDDRSEDSPESKVGSDSDGVTSAQAEGSGASLGVARLSVHGFMTQAWADADFADPPVVQLPDGTTGPIGPSPTGFEAAIGIPEDGTTNYRFLALQFRYDISPKDVFVVQLSSRALGFSPTTAGEDEIELDWAFYERRLTDNSSLKVGRVQIPMGIFNEIRDVGTILPFYRPPFNFYREGAFTSETVDGLSLTHEFLPDSDWGLEVSGYAGEWELISVDPNDPLVAAGTSPAKDGYGYQIWLQTPIPQLRIGTGLVSYRAQATEGAPFVPINRIDITHASLEGIFGRFTIRVEGQETDIKFPGPFGFQIALGLQTWYAQAGYQITDQFSVWIQRDEDTVDNDCGCFLVDRGKRNNASKWGFAVNYAFTPQIVLKGEHHLTEATAIDRRLDFSTGAPRLVDTLIPYDEGSYTIVSLSVSF